MDLKKLEIVSGVQADYNTINGWLTRIRNNELPNPDVVFESAGSRLQNYRELLYDAHVKSCVQSRKSGVLSLEWEINRGGVKTEEVLLIEKIFNELDIHKIISEMLDAVFLGHAFLEIYWLPLGGRIVPVDIVGKPQEWFFFNTNREARFRKDRRSEGKPLNPKKFFIVQHNPTYTNPYGEAALSPCFWPIFYKKSIIKKWVDFAEKFGQPVVDLSVPPAYDTKNISDLIDDIAKMADDSIFAHPSDVEMKFIESVRTTTIAIYQNAVSMFNTEVSKAILSQTLTTEQSSTGSYAMSQTHFQIRGDIVDSDKRMVEKHFNNLIKWIVELNFGTLPEMPRFEMYEKTQVDLPLSQRDVNLTSTGQVRFTKEYFKRNYGFKDDEIEIVEPQAAAPALGAFADDEETVTNDVDDINNIGYDDFIKEPEAISDKIVSMISEKKSLNEIQTELIKMLPALKNDTRKIQEYIADAINKAQAIGLVAAHKGINYNESIVKRLFSSLFSKRK